MITLRLAPLIVALYLAAANSGCDDFELTILHTNDIHSRIQEIDKRNNICKEDSKGPCYGGYPRIKTEVDKQRKEATNSILVDGGDQFQGSLWFFLYGGVVLSHFMNLVGYTAMGLGNHEFDQGPEGLAPFLQNATFPVLSSNIDTSKTPELRSIKKSVVVERSGEKIGIIGFTTTETKHIAKPGKVEFHSEIESIQDEANRLRKQGVNKIIAIGHAGYHKDMEIGQKVRGVDVVVGGHTNTFLYKGPTPTVQQAVGEYPTVVTNPDGGKVLIVQDYAYGKYLGKLKVTFDEEGRVKHWSGNPILLDSSVEKDRNVLDDVNALLPAITKKRQSVIGNSMVHLVSDRSVCRRYECNLGNLVADGMVRQNLIPTKGDKWSTLTMAVVTANGLRKDLNKGPITIADVLEVQPFRNTVDLVVITGKTIKEMLEHSVGRRLDVDDGFGGFLQMSGIRVVYDLQQPKGRKVHRVRVMCSNCLVPEFVPLEMEKKYLVAMQKYLIDGKKGYDMIKDGIIKKFDIGNFDSDIMMRDIKQQTPITTGLDGRIQFLQDIKDNDLC